VPPFASAAINHFFTTLGRHTSLKAMAFMHFAFISFIKHYLYSLKGFASLKLYAKKVKYFQ